MGIDVKKNETARCHAGGFDLTSLPVAQTRRHENFTDK